jgi:signal transduction histidine kinase
MKSNLVSTVSHELMTPLTSLSMALHILLGERIGALEPKQIELLTTAREDADRLRSILEGLLDVSRLEAGAAGLRLVPTPVGEIVAEATDPLRPAFRDKGVELATELGNEGLAVRADKTQAALLLGNLLTNALKHTPAGGAVTLSARALDAGRTEISVQDSGTGIPAEYHERVFDRFYRTPGETSRGAGLGLAIAREIAEAHGGRLWLDPEGGPGATFRIELQRAG